MANVPQAYNLGFMLEQSSKIYPNKDVVLFATTKINYKTLNAMVNQVANGLVATGLKQGDTIALSCPNLPFFPVVYYAILKIGAIVVPLNVLLKKDEIKYHLEDSKAKAYFCFIGTPELPMAKEGKAGFDQVKACKNFFLITPTPDTPVPEEFKGLQTLFGLMKDKSSAFSSVSTNADDIAVLLYTSGTTGKAKGAALTHSNIYQNALTCQTLFKTDANDRFLIALPLFHSFGQTTQMNHAVLIGASMLLIARFDPKAVLDAFQNQGITTFAGVPTMYWALLNYPEKNKYDFEKIRKNLRLVASGGASLPVEIIKQFDEEFQVPILEGYGLSETSPVATFGRLDLVRKPGSIGVPIVGCEVKLVDEKGKEPKIGETGEILIRGVNIMKEYWGKPKETAEAFKDGWFHSGDIGRVDEDGYYYIVDRVKDMIIRGGFNVYPRELEEVLMTHPAVSLCTVIGIPDKQYGEEIKAFIVKKPNAQVTEEEIITWSKEKMASYKYPRHVEFREALPMTATGKILKRDLRQK